MSSDTPPVIGFICGSTREGSINKTLEKALIKRFKRAGLKTTSINLATYDLPIYHGDLDMPVKTRLIGHPQPEKRILRRHIGVLLPVRQDR